MRAAQVTAMGGPDVLTVADLPDPTPGPGELLVRVEAAGVGPWDTKMRSGGFGPQQTPYIPGAELVDDGRKDATIDTVLGAAYTSVAPQSEVDTALAAPSPSPSGPGCSPTAVPTAESPAPAAESPSPAAS